MMGEPKSRFLSSGSLLGALEPKYPEIVTLTGAGGKTTTMLHLAREAYAVGKRMLVTVTTKIYESDAARFGPLVYAAEKLSGKRLAVYVAGKDESTGKLIGIDPDAIPDGFDLVLVEADGSAGKPLTAPKAHEPVIPASTTTVLAVAGLDALGQPVHAMHRPEVIANLTGVSLDAPVNAEVMAAVLSHPLGNTKGRPARARVIYLLNKADDDERLQHGKAVAELLPGPVLATSHGRVRWSKPVG